MMFSVTAMTRYEKKPMSDTTPETAVFVFSLFFTLISTEGARITNVMIKYKIHTRSMLQYMSTSEADFPSIPDSEDSASDSRRFAPTRYVTVSKPKICKNK